jgi:hypothetical protein
MVARSQRIDMRTGHGAAEPVREIDVEFLRSERETLERLLPGLDEALTEIGLADLERPAGPGVQAFRDAGGAGLLVPAVPGGLGGAKRPCSLSRSMDLLTASVLVPDESGQEQLVVALVPAGSPGLEVNPFWGVGCWPGRKATKSC